MAKIMIFNVPAYGHVNVTLAVVHELVQHGHEVIYYCGHELREVIEKTGVEFRQYPDTGLSSQAIADRAHNLANISVLLMEASQTLIPFAINEIENEKPDAVMYDAINIWARVATLLTDTPSIVSFPVTILEGAKGVLDLRMLLYTIVTALPKMPKFLHCLSKLKKDYGKEVLQFPLFPSKGQLNLVFSSREYQIATPFIDDSFRFVGASINPALRTESPLDLSHIDKPLIYISLGTVNNKNLNFYQTVLCIFADYPAHFILSIGKQLSTQQLHPIPDNFQVMKSVPQLQVLQRTDVFVTHGGMNSIQEALYYGVPQVIVPQQLEQAINGLRVQALGAGLVLSPSPPYGAIDAERLYRAVDDVLHQPQYKQSAEQQRQASRASGGYKQAVADIEAFIG